MKKLFCAAIMAFFLLSMTACGNNGESAPAPASVSPQGSIYSNPVESVGFNDDYNGGEDEIPQESLKPEAVSWRNQTFYRVSPFSEGRAWVEYRDETQNITAAVINTAGELVFAPEQRVIAYLPYSDGYSVYLYAPDPAQSSSSDGLRACIVDSNGNITYDSSKDGCRFIFAYGGEYFLALEHTSNFDTDEWSFGAVDKNGNTVVAFSECEDFNGYPTSLVSECKYLGEDIFLLKNTIYNLQSKSAIWYVNPKFGDSPTEFVKGKFYEGRALVFKEALLEAGLFNLTSTGENTLLVKSSSLKAYDVSEYADGLYFYDGEYHDIDGNTKISFPQYDGKYFKGGTFCDGHAPLYIRGADGEDYFTIIDLQGNVLFDPTPGYPSEYLSEGYLVVHTKSGSAVYDTSGKKVSESEYTVQGKIGYDSVRVTDGYYVACQKGADMPTIYVGVDGSCIGQ